LSKLFVEYLVHLTEISVVCIANHNSGEGIQEIIDYLNSKQDFSDYNNPYNQTQIFPGVEVGGNDKCHIIIAFNPKTTNSKKFIFSQEDSSIEKELNWAEYIDNFLTDIKVPNPRFNNSQPCNSVKLGASDIINKSDEWDFVAIFPHIENNSGLWQELQENNRKDVYNNKFFGIVDIKSDSTNSNLKLILNGTHKKWGDKKVAIIESSDANSLSKIGERYSWIKADPTYEGLKQIMFEPNLRVSNNSNFPETKPSYQIIDKIEINNELIYNTSLEINSYLNSIIGGRSTGKSILLASIAKKLKTDTPIQFGEAKQGYDDLINSISESLKIFWKDNVIDNTREVEFFEQGYMYSIARNETKKNELIQKILKAKGKEALLSSYKRNVAENKKYISDLLSDFFKIKTEISEKKQSVSDKGDLKGITEEITRLETELKKINTSQITEEEKQTYTTLKEQIESDTLNKTNIQNDIQIINDLKSFSFLKENIDYELTALSEKNKKKIQDIFDVIGKEIKEKWNLQLASHVKILNEELTVINGNLKNSNENVIYKKVSKAFQESTKLSELDERIKKEKDKRQIINSLNSEIDELKKQLSTILKDIRVAFNSFETFINDIRTQLSDSVDDLEILANAKLKDTKVIEFLKSSLHQNRKHNLTYLSGAFGILNNNISIEEYVFTIFDDVIEDKLEYKGDFDSLSFSTKLLSENYFALDYDLIYDGDNFDKMSEGKKAFVILKLLLDFSDKECPILIDPPEDDLDNRAIYTELVQYIRKKKINRQIILATHNPNIVVGSDSELVIVANQHGIKNKNTDSTKKFQYVAGSLENTRVKDDSIEIILDSQGIREHVCDILEGGTTAFLSREKKYDKLIAHS
jgi:predicted ATPase